MDLRGVIVLVLEIILCLLSIFIVAVVLLQSGKSAGISGDIAGGAETFLGKSKAKSYEGKLKKLTKIAAVSIMTLAVVMVIIQVYVPGGPGSATTSASPSATTSATTTPAPLYVPSPSVAPSASASAATTTVAPSAS